MRRKSTKAAVVGNALQVVEEPLQGRAGVQINWVLLPKDASDAQVPADSSSGRGIVGLADGGCQVIEIPCGGLVSEREVF